MTTLSRIITTAAAGAVCTMLAAPASASCSLNGDGSEYLACRKAERQQSDLEDRINNLENELRGQRRLLDQILLEQSFNQPATKTAKR